ncbi:MAG TPA: hypothetical protein PL151_12680, partial [Phycisphaerae bacterium]|nr:hypothetical protein [Phycisphaerae bacterium]
MTDQPVREDQQNGQAAAGVADADGADTSAAVPALDLAQSKDYARVKRWCHLSGIAISVAYWVFWTAVAFSFVGWLDGFIDNRWLGLLVTA